MDNTKTQATLGTTHRTKTKKAKNIRKLKGQSRMDNTQHWAQHTEQRQRKQKTQHRKLKGQSRMDNTKTQATLGTTHRTKTKKAKNTT